MGKRKKSSRKPQGPKKKAVLPTSFSCLFCNHEGSVNVKLDKKAGTGELSCKICGQHFQTGINYLSAAVDVYSDWIDACDAVAKDAARRDDHDLSGLAHSKDIGRDGSLHEEESEDIRLDVNEDEKDDYDE